MMYESKNKEYFSCTYRHQNKWGKCNWYEAKTSMVIKNETVTIFSNKATIILNIYPTNLMWK